MPGGNKNIKGSDNPKPFTKGGINGKTFEIWTEDKVHKILDELEEWLMETIEIKDDKDNVIEIIDAGNCFYKYFLYKMKLFDDWIGYVKKKFSTVADRMNHINKIQEIKLQYLASNGTQKENITKFILTNKHGWRDRQENENINKNMNIIWNETKSYDNEKDKNE